MIDVELRCKAKKSAGIGKKRDHGEDEESGRNAIDIP